MTTPEARFPAASRRVSVPPLPLVIVSVIIGVIAMATYQAVATSMIVPLPSIPVLLFLLYALGVVVGALASPALRMQESAAGSGIRAFSLLPLFFFVAGAVFLAWMGREPLRTIVQSTPETEIVAKTDVPAFSPLTANDFTILPAQTPVAGASGTATAPAEAQLRKEVEGRLTLRRLTQGQPIDPDADLGPPADELTDQKALSLVASDPFGTLAAGDIIDLILVPVVAGEASPQPQSGGSAKASQQDYATGDETVLNARILQVGDTTPDGLRSIVVAMQSKELPVGSVGRAVAYPVYIVGK